MGDSLESAICRGVIDGTLWYQRWMSCIFCQRRAAGKWTLTVRKLDGSWRREIDPVCPRCNALLDLAGRDGRVLKATGERWYASHTVGWPVAASQAGKD